MSETALHARFADADASGAVRWTAPGLAYVEPEPLPPPPSVEDLQALLREVPNDRLGLALRGADAKVKEKITRNMSQRAAQILLEDMEARGPVRLSDVEGAQKEILAIVRRLADQGVISLMASAEEMV